MVSKAASCGACMQESRFCSILVAVGLIVSCCKNAVQPRCRIRDHLTTSIPWSFADSLGDRSKSRSRPHHFIERIYFGQSSGLLLSFEIRTFSHTLGIVGIGSFSASPGSLFETERSALLSLFAIVAAAAKSKQNRG